MSEVRTFQSVNQMPSNSIFETLDPSGSLGIGETRRAIHRARESFASAQVKTVSVIEPSLNSEINSPLQSSSPGDKESGVQVSQSVLASTEIKSLKKVKQSQSPLVGIVVLGSVLGVLGFGSLVTSSINSPTNGVGNTSYNYNVDSIGSIPSGKARFKSGRTGNTELIGVSISHRFNSNGHATYDARWSDGYDSSYVFWENGRAEIFSKNGDGSVERTSARFKRLPNGDCVITASTGSVTTFPDFNPLVN